MMLKFFVYNLRWVLGLALGTAVAFPLSTAAELLGQVKRSMPLIDSQGKPLRYQASRMPVKVRPNATFRILSRGVNYYRIKTGEGLVGFVPIREVLQFTSTQIDRDSETQAQCAACSMPRRLPKISKSTGVGSRALAIARQQCLQRKLIAAVESEAQSRMYRGLAFTGDCMRAIRYGLQQAGMYAGDGFGNAKDTVPGFLSLGFKLRPEIQSPEDAPENSILVYGAALVKGCEGSGTIYGHVELKRSSGRYLLDGVNRRNVQAYHGPLCRPLIAVLTVGDQCPSCSDKVKQECGLDKGA